jgi:hypothetical protein
LRRFYLLKREFSSMPNPPTPPPICPLCNDPIKENDTKIGVDGKAVHEGCYIMSVITKTMTPAK